SRLRNVGASGNRRARGWPRLFFLSRRDRLVALAVRHSVPAIYPWREAAVAGGVVRDAARQTDTDCPNAPHTTPVFQKGQTARLPLPPSTHIKHVTHTTHTNAP